MIEDSPKAEVWCCPVHEIGVALASPIKFAQTHMLFVQCIFAVHASR